MPSRPRSSPSIVAATETDSQFDGQGARPCPPSGSGGSALVFVAAGAALISFAAIFVKAVSADGVGPSAIGMWRTLLGSAILFVTARAMNVKLVLPTPAIVGASLAGAAFAFDLFVWHRSIVLVGAGLATILGNMQVFWAAAIGRVTLNEPVSARFAAAAGVAFIGVVLLAGAGSDVELSPDYVAGLVYGLLTGVAYATYVIFLRRSNTAADDGSYDSQTARSIVVLAWVTLVSGVLLGAASFVEGEVMVPSTRAGVAGLIGLAVVAQVLGWLIISLGLRRVAAAMAGLVLLLQPALATLWGVLLFRERFTGMQLVGAAITLVAVYAGTRYRS